MKLNLEWNKINVQFHLPFSTGVYLLKINNKNSMQNMVSWF